jgi:hypothetical protein
MGVLSRLEYVYRNRVSSVCLVASIEALKLIRREAYPASLFSQARLAGVC